MLAQDILVFVLDKCIYTIFILADVLINVLEVALKYLNSKNVYYLLYIFLQALSLLFTFEKKLMSFGITLLVMLYVPSGIFHFKENYKHFSRNMYVCVLQVLFYPILLPTYRFKEMCSNKNTNNLEYLEKSRFLIDAPLKLILLVILILSTEDLFEEKKLLFWYASMKFEGWYDNILDIQKVSFVSCLFYGFVMIKSLLKPEQFNTHLLDGINKLCYDLVSLYFQTSALIYSILYLEIYGLILISLNFGIFLGITRHENGCLFKCLSMLLNPINDISSSNNMDVCCEISKMTLHCLNMILCLVMINGDFLNYDKWTILRRSS